MDDVETEEHFAEFLSGEVWGFPGGDARGGHLVSRKS